MSKTYNLTGEQVDFVAFMKKGVSSHLELLDRWNSCMSGMSTKQAETSREIVLHHSPKKMIEFLSLFSRDDRFKWYTHKWDMSVPFNIDEFKGKQITDKKVLRQMAYPKESGPVVNENTFNQVWNFINFMNDGSNIFPWKNNKFESIRCGWHCIADLSRNNPDIAVENLKLPDEHQFRDYIRMFKAVIEFRTDLKDEDRFSELVWNLISSSIPKDFEVIFSEKFDEIGYDLNVYCDVVGILSAINVICNWIVKHKTRSSEVKVDLISKDECYILEIFHCGSYFDNMEKLEQASGDFASLRQRLFSVCDFFMEGDYMIEGKMQGSLIVNALDENVFVKTNTKAMTPCNIIPSETKVGGVKYQIKIYKRP